LCTNNLAGRERVQRGHREACQVAAVDVARNIKPLAISCAATDHTLAGGERVQRGHREACQVAAVDIARNIKL
jgi:hypothetical protein